MPCHAVHSTHLPMPRLILISLCAEQFGDARTALGSGLLHYGLAPHQTVGIYSVNCTVIKSSTRT